MTTRSNAKRNTPTLTFITTFEAVVFAFVATVSCSLCQAEESMANTRTDDTWKLKVKSLKYRFPDSSHEHVAVVSISDQELYLYKQGELDRVYPVSTSRYGAGNEDGSLKTPLGVHRVVSKIGWGAPAGTIFKGRENTHRQTRIYKARMRGPYDFVTTRILQLEGLEPGINKGKGIDTYARNVYIHGTHEEGLIGEPASIGCVRMKNQDVIELFTQVAENSIVLIVE